MSIEELKFTLRSQAFLAGVLQNYFAEALFFAYCPANFEAAPPLILGKQKAGIAPSLCIDIYSSTKFKSKFIRILAA